MLISSHRTDLPNEAIQVQLIYAAPFFLLSLVGFTFCAIGKKQRRFALSALLAPVAFGVCSLAGWIVYAIISDRLHKGGLGPNSLWLYGLAFYVLPGFIGSWLAASVTLRLEHILFRTERTRSIALQVEIAAVVFPLGFILSLSGIDNWLSWLWMDHAAEVLAGAVLGGGLISAAVFMASRGVQVDPESKIER